MIHGLSQKEYNLFCVLLLIFTRMLDDLGYKTIIKELAIAWILCGRLHA